MLQINVLRKHNVAHYFNRQTPLNYFKDAIEIPAEIPINKLEYQNTKYQVIKSSIECHPIVNKV